jgi:hypothetical protein
MTVRQDARFMTTGKKRKKKAKHPIQVDGLRADIRRGKHLCVSKKSTSKGPPGVSCA